MAQRETPEINAGSMADIAFLLVLFFLVTSTMDSDVGILKRLPDKKNNTHIVDVNKRNVLSIQINATNEILLNNTKDVTLKDVRQATISFIDNGAGKDAEGNTCTWCNGNKDILSSEHPTKAIIQLESNRNTSYETYIAVQNEVTGAYNELRNRLSISLYGKPFEDLLRASKHKKKDTALHLKIKNIKAKYPQLIFEKEPIQID